MPRIFHSLDPLARHSSSRYALWHVKSFEIRMLESEEPQRDERRKEVTGLNLTSPERVFSAPTSSTTPSNSAQCASCPPTTMYAPRRPDGQPVKPFPIRNPNKPAPAPTQPVRIYKGRQVWCVAEHIRKTESARQLLMLMYDGLKGAHAASVYAASDCLTVP